MNRDEIRELIYKELPRLLREDTAMREYVLELTRERFADRRETESRFEAMLEELRRDRELNEARWQETREWWRESQAKWEANEARWEANEARWEENQARWEANEARWEENQATIREMLAEIKRLDKQHDSTIGALGARWGLHSEASFRNGLRGILQDYFDVEVLRVNEFDESGEVFGRPEQIELDLIVQDGALIIAEIKSSMSIADMYIFSRKAEFYERLHQREAARKLVISPMVDERAKEAAQELGVEVYSYADDVSLD